MKYIELITELTLEEKISINGGCLIYGLPMWMPGIIYHPTPLHKGIKLFTN